MGAAVDAGGMGDGECGRACVDLDVDRLVVDGEDDVVFAECGEIAIERLNGEGGGGCGGGGLRKKRG